MALSDKPVRWYWFNVKGGGRFMCDAIDVGRTAIAMAERGDNRPFTVKPFSRWDRFVLWAVDRWEDR